MDDGAVKMTAQSKLSVTVLLLLILRTPVGGDRAGKMILGSVDPEPDDRCARWYYQLIDHSINSSLRMVTDSMPNNWGCQEICCYSL